MHPITELRARGEYLNLLGSLARGHGVGGRGSDKRFILFYSVIQQKIHIKIRKKQDTYFKANNRILRRIFYNYRHLCMKLGNKYCVSVLVIC